MIDIENKIINDITVAVRNEFGSDYPNLTCLGEYVDVPSGFPCVTIVEEDNYVYRNSQDENTENNANVMYSVNIYTNNINGKKQLAKKIADVVDGVMSGYSFTRMTRTPIPNEDRTIYRIVMRYSAVVSKGMAVGENTTVFQINRK